jgi:hypothetical protein
MERFWCTTKAVCSLSSELSDLYSATTFEKEYEFDDNLLPNIRAALSTVMAKLPPDISEKIWRLKRQFADIIENARFTEFSLFLVLL